MLLDLSQNGWSRRICDQSRRTQGLSGLPATARDLPLNHNARSARGTCTRCLIDVVALVSGSPLNWETTA